MRRQRGLVGLTGLAALVGLGVVAKPAMSAVTTEKSASILVFPKVIANGTRDTIIQITNTSNSVQHAHCFYVNGAPSGTNRPPLCLETDFDIWLTKQQPTHWVVSKGRQTAFEANCSTTTAGQCSYNNVIQPQESCTTSSQCLSAANGVCMNVGACNPLTAGGLAANCCDAGFDPGRIPPVAPDFVGELFCVLTDAGDSPYPGNAIKGEATLEDLATGDVSKYNGIGLIGYNSNNGDNALCLGPDGATSASCASREYEACPATWYVDHAARGAFLSVEEAQPEGECFYNFVNSHELCATSQACITFANGVCVNTEPGIASIQPNITVVPCTINLESQAPTSVTLQFDIINEFELHLSASTTLTCWASWDLGASSGGVSDAFNVLTTLGSVLQTRVRSANALPTQANGGVMMIVEETHTLNNTTTTAKSAQNVHTSFADHAGLDVVTIPGDQIGPQQP